MSSSSAASSSSGNDAVSLRRERILSSKLYFDVPTSKVYKFLGLDVCDFFFPFSFIFIYLFFLGTNQVPLIYSSTYDIAFLGIEKL